jgi:D-glycero-D-manno-heptose 1,7-bisphosphate phosphatase
MIHRAAQDLDIDIPGSFVVGDRWLDVEMGRAAGTQAVLVRTGYGQNEERRPDDQVTADYVADNLMDAASWILRRLRAHPPTPLGLRRDKGSGLRQ